MDYLTPMFEDVAQTSGRCVVGDLMGSIGGEEARESAGLCDPRHSALESLVPESWEAFRGCFRTGTLAK